MADNTVQSGADTIATDDVATLNGGASSGVKVQRVKVAYGDDGDSRDASTAFPLPTTAQAGKTLATPTSSAFSAATGTVGPVDVSTYSSIAIVIKNTVAATSWTGTGSNFPSGVFEQSDDNVSWAPLYAVRKDTGAINMTFNLRTTTSPASIEMVWSASVEGVSYVRVRLTNRTQTNSLTISVIPLQTYVPPLSAVVASVAEGIKHTYSCPLNSGVSAGHSGTAELFGLNNPAASTNLVRVTRVQLAVTLATAASVANGIVVGTRSPATGGTSTSQLGTFLQTHVTTGSNFTQQATALYFTVAPTSGGGVSFARHWRFFAPATVLTATTPPATIEYIFGGGRPAQGIAVTPGVTFGVAFVSSPATAPTLTGDIEWTEEPI